MSAAANAANPLKPRSVSAGSQLGLDNWLRD
jgi:hypothetical protein